MQNRTPRWEGVLTLSARGRYLRAVSTAYAPNGPYKLNANWSTKRQVWKLPSTKQQSTVDHHHHQVPRRSLLSAV